MPHLASRRLLVLEPFRARAYSFHDAAPPSADCCECPCLAPAAAAYGGCYSSSRPVVVALPLRAGCPQDPASVQLSRQCPFGRHQSHFLLEVVLAWLAFVDGWRYRYDCMIITLFFLSSTKTTSFAMVYPSDHTAA